MNNEIELSVIVPVYNSIKYIRPCLDSILNQDFPHRYEILISFYPSTDGTDEIIDEYKKQNSAITLIKNSQRGISFSRFDALKHARGKYIYFVDADDFIAPTTLKVLHELLETYDADISHCNFHVIENRNGVDEIKLNPFPLEGVFDKYQAIKYLQQDTKIRSFFWTKMFKRELLENLPYDLHLENWQGMFDDAFPNFVLFCSAKKVISTSKPLYYYRKGLEGSDSSKLNPKRMDYHIDAYALERYFIDLSNDKKLFKEYRHMVFRYRWTLYFDAYASRKIPDYHFWKEIKKANAMLKLFKRKEKIPVSGYDYEANLKRVFNIKK